MDNTIGSSLVDDLISQRIKEPAAPPEPEAAPDPAGAAADAVMNGILRTREIEDRIIIRNNSKIDAARQAEALRLSKQHNIPVGVAYRQVEDIQRTNLELANEERRKNNPAWSTLLTRDDVGPIAQEEGNAEELQFIEQAFANISGPKHSLLGDLAAGWDQLLAGQSAKSVANAAEDLRRLEDGKKPGLSGFAPGGMPAPQLTDEEWKTKIGGELAGAGRGVAQAQADLARNPESAAMREWNKDKTPISFLLQNPQLVLEIPARSALASTPSMVAGAAGFAVGGLPGGALGAAAGSLDSEYGSTIVEELTKRGADFNDPASVMAIWDKDGEAILRKAEIRGGVVGLFDGISALVGGKIAGIETPLNAPVKKVLLAVFAKEVLGVSSDMALGGIGEGAAAVASGDELSVKNMLNEAIGELVPGVVQTTTAIVTEGRAARAEAQQQALIEIGDKIRKSKIAKTSPETIIAHAEALDENGQAPAMSVPAEALLKLFQSEGLTPEQAEERVPGILAAIEEAGQTNVEVTLPAATAMRLMQMENFSSITGDIRMGGDPTANEAARDTTDLDKLVETVSAEDQKVAVRASVEAEVAKQMVATGMEQRTAETNAKLHVTVMSRFAENTGKDLDTIMRENPLKIVRDGMEPGVEGGTTLQQDTSTPEFRNWFGDSKVTDEAGAPLVVYHGTTSASDFAVFRPKTGAGIYFSPDQRLASTYAGGSRRTPEGGRVIPVYLSMRNPKIIGSGTLGPSMRAAAEWDSESISSAFVSASQVQELKSQGFDGIINYDTREIVAFDPTQIKSVNNRGTFDPANPNILMQSEPVPTPDEELDESIDDLEGELEDDGFVGARVDQVDALVADKDIPVITLRDLIGKKIFPTIADRTAAAALYTGIDGSKLNIAIPLLGGPYFPLRVTNWLSNIVWANRGKGVTSQKAARLKDGANYMLVVMGDANMHQSNTTVSRAFFGTLQAYARDNRVKPEGLKALAKMITDKAAEMNPVVDIKPKNKKALEKAAARTEPLVYQGRELTSTQALNKKHAKMKADLEVFPGFADEKVLDDYLDNISFDARKEVLRIMGTKEAKAFGVPSMEKILAATIQPQLAGHRWGDGVLLVELDQTNPQVDLGKEGTTKHPDFPLGIRGKVIGKLNTPVNYETLWGDWLKTTEEEAKAKNIAEGTPDKSVNVRRAFELSKPIVEVTQALVDRIGKLAPGNIESHRQARLAADFALGNWRDASTQKNKGGLSVQGFIDALAASEASATLSPPGTASDLKAAVKKGKLQIKQLGSGEIYYALKDGSNYEWAGVKALPNDKTLTSVVNNELGAGGIASPAVLLDAIANGATVLDCFAVKSSRFPGGFLPALYRAFGFEIVGQVPFDPTQFSGNLADAEAFWTKYRWNKDDGYPDVVVMRWKGTDADRKGILERYLKGGIDGVLGGRTPVDAQAAEDELVRLNSEAAGSAGAADAGGAAGDPGARNGASVASRAQSIVRDIGNLTDQEARNLGLDPKDRDKVANLLANEQAPSPGPSSSGTTLNQTGQSTQTTARGFIEIAPGRTEFKITLTGRADLSTFQHEAAHYYLEVLQKLVESGSASPELTADLEKIHRWVGIGPKTGMGPVQKLGVREHEMFARGWEAYLMEGRSPSNELQGVFNRFRAWMVFIYKKLTALDVQLTDEVRSVFDRLVASDQEIADARTSIGVSKPLPKTALYLSDDEYDRYVEAWNKANEEQQRDLDGQLMREAAQETKAAWKEERARLIKEETDTLAKTRGYRAWKLLSTGEGLDTDAPGRTSIKIDPDTVPAEWRRDTTGMTEEGGLPLDAVAEILGFDSGEQMISLIAGAKFAERDIPRTVIRKMQETHGHMDAVALADAAIDAVHSDKGQEVLLTEYRAMAAKAGIGAPPKGLAQWMAAQASQKVMALTKRQLDPTRWRRAELKAATDSAKAAAKGDVTKAAIHKRQQMMAAAVYRATIDASKRVDVIRNKLMPFTKNDRRAKLGKAGDLYLDGIDEILEAIQLKPMSAKAVEKISRLEKLVEAANEAGEPLVLPDKLRAMLGKKNFADMTVEELQGVHDAVMNIWHLAKLKNELKARNEKRELTQVLEEAAANADASLGTTPLKKSFQEDWRENSGSRVNKWRASLSKMEFILTWLDNKPGGLGLLHRLIFQPLADANKRKYELMRHYHESIIQYMHKMPAEQKARWAAKRNFLGAPDATGAQIIMAALNLGNEGNKSRLFKGYGLDSPQQQQALLAEIDAFLTKEDVEFIRHVWKELDLLWPDIARVTKAATGLEPERVVPTPFVTRFGTFEGGYFPAVYNLKPNAWTDMSVTEAMKTKKDNSDPFTNSYLNPALSDGFTKGRIDMARNPPLLLDLSVIATHLAEVTHYVTHYEAVIQAHKIIKDPRFAKIVTETMGVEFYRPMKQWLIDIATDQDAPPITREEPVAEAMQWLRGGVTIANMGFNFFTGFKQLLGVIPAIDEVGIKYMAIGMAKAWASPNVVQNWKDAFKKSGVLWPLLREFDRDVRKINDIYMKSPTLNRVQQARAGGFAHIGFMQAVVNVATWQAAYDKALDKKMTEQEAIDYADATVRMTQGSGNPMDLAPVQRGSEVNKMLTVHYSWLSVLFNRLDDVNRRTRRIKNVPKAMQRVFIMLTGTVIVEEIFRQAWEAVVDNVDDEEDDEWVKGFILTSLFKTADTAISTIPLLRTVASTEYMFGDGFKPELTPIGRVFTDLERSATALRDIALEGELPNRSEGKALARTASVVTQTPLAGVYNLIDEFLGEAIFDERRKQ